MVVTGRWEYYTVAGQKVTVERYEPGPDGRKKGFRHSPEGVKGPFLPYLSDSIRDGTVYVTEGEKDCDLLLNLGYNATTFRGGGGSYGHTDWSCLKGREVVICPDRDETGRKMCEGLTARLLNQVGAAKVFVAEPPKGERDGYNVCDGTPERIAECLKAPTEITVKRPVRLVELDLTAKIEMPRTLITNLMEIGLPSIMFGQPSSGKSTLAILQAVALASGRGDIIRAGDIEPVHVAFIWREETKGTLTAKIRAVMDEHGVGLDELEGRMTYLADGDGNPWAGNLAVREQIPHIRDELLRCGVRALFIDSLSAVAPEAEMKNDIAAQTANGLVELCHAIDGSMTVIHHSRKVVPGQQVTIGMEESRGASAVYGTARIVTQTEKTNDFLDDAETKTVYRLHTVKANNFRAPEPAAFTIKGWLAGQDDRGKDIWVPCARMIAPDDVRGPFAGISRQDAVRAWRALCDSPQEKRRKSDKTEGYAGKIVAESLNIALETATGKRRVGAFLKAWLDSGHLSVSSFREKGQDRPIYERGERNLAADDD